MDTSENKDEMREISGNKGEWSEIYTLFKLLGDGKVYAGDADMNKLELYYPIINVIREESKRYVYSPDVKQNIVIIDEDGNEYAKISMDRFVEESGKLLKKIKAADKRTFTIHETQEFMKEVGCTKLKAPSKDKADIHIVIHDLRTGMRPLLGFSIKSQLGSASTLLNAGTPTNITYRLTGYELSDEEIEEINAVKSHVDRMSAIIEKGCHLEYHDIEHSVWRTRQTLWRAVQMLTQKLCCQTIHDCPKVVPLHYESE